jgi:hypothetical protein
MSRPCSEATREQGEPLAGSAGEVTALVAIAWPKPLWDPDDADRSEGLPAGLGALVADEQSRGRKVSVRVFQRQARPPTDRVELAGVVPSEARSIHVREVPVAELVERVGTFLDGASSPPIDPPLALVCTDGRHDRCCAREGRGVYEAFREEVSRRGLALEVAESSHLGGHRFAATCLLLPSGEMYGRLRPPDVPAVVGAYESSSVWVPRFRGRLGSPEPVQVAEVHVRGLHPELVDLELELAHGPGQQALVRVRGGEIDLEVECRPRTFRAPTSCNEGVSESRERWVVAEVRESRSP